MAVIISLFSVFISFRRNRGQMVQLAFELQWTKLLWVFDFFMHSISLSKSICEW